jgi:hypothetical protein
MTSSTVNPNNYHNIMREDDFIGAMNNNTNDNTEYDDNKNDNPEGTVSIEPRDTSSSVRVAVWVRPF